MDYSNLLFTKKCHVMCTQYWTTFLSYLIQSCLTYLNKYVFSTCRIMHGSSSLEELLEKIQTDPEVRDPRELPSWHVLKLMVWIFIEAGVLKWPSPRTKPGKSTPYFSSREHFWLSYKNVDFVILKQRNTFFAEFVIYFHSYFYFWAMFLEKNLS